MKFLDCGNTPLGIYPVVDRAYKLEALYQAGITTAQLRVKDMSGHVLKNEIIEAIRISEKYDARLFVNDFWELAIKQGISTHTRDEIKIAEHIEPSYLAIGPIFETNSKKMVYDPVGIEDLKRWSESVAYPIVAIGGINLDTISDVIATNAANGVAMIAGVLEKDEVSEKKTKALIEIFEKIAK
jgi:thiamine-phosphate pyrophosphorylase/hydroxymethylpyrimidine kinase/phosphomethylpyrimidine kinase/thiamine-phosphate diphosphorylase